MGPKSPKSSKIKVWHNLKVCLFGIKYKSNLTIDLKFKVRVKSKYFQI